MPQILSPQEKGRIERLVRDDGAVDAVQSGSPTDLVVCVQSLPEDGDGDEQLAVTFADGATEPYTRLGLRRSNLRYSVQAFADTIELGLDLALPQGA